MKQKLYFENADKTTCYTLDNLIEMARKEGIDQLNLFEAIEDTDEDFFWCTYLGDPVYKCECIKPMCGYYKSNKSGRGTCIHRGKLYRLGKKINIKL